MFEIEKNTIAKNFKGFIVIIVMKNFCKNFLISKIFPLRFPGIFANVFQCKIIPVYRTCRAAMVYDSPVTFLGSETV
mgnify:CR=1